MVVTKAAPYAPFHDPDWDDLKGSKSVTITTITTPTSAVDELNNFTPDDSSGDDGDAKEH